MKKGDCPGNIGDFFGSFFDSGFQMYGWPGMDSRKEEIIFCHYGQFIIRRGKFTLIIPLFALNWRGSKMEYKFKRIPTHPLFGWNGSMKVLVSLPNWDVYGNIMTSWEEAKRYWRSVPIKVRKEFIEGEIVFEIPDKIYDLETLLVVLHEFGHYHNKDYLTDKCNEGYEGMLEIEVKAWAYALRGIKPEFYKKAFKFLLPKLMTYVMSSEFVDNASKYKENLSKYTRTYMTNWIMKEMESILNHKGGI